MLLPHTIQILQQKVFRKGEQKKGLVYKLGPVSAALLLPTGMRHLAVAHDIETLTAGMSYSNNQHYDYKIFKGISQTDLTRYMSNNCGEIFG